MKTNICWIIIITITIVIVVIIIATMWILLIIILIWLISYIHSNDSAFSQKMHMVQGVPAQVEWSSPSPALFVSALKLNKEAQHACKLLSFSSFVFQRWSITHNIFASSLTVRSIIMISYLLVCICVCIRICMCTYIYIYIYIYVCMYVCVYIYIYIYIYIQGPRRRRRAPAQPPRAARRGP